ncbi:hypothetical protein KYK29_05355 [Shinella daejeonensis]|uniref:hypothetical protein n=1 Tax=Shinella daejeonensis TaxID=659017 RepID=UPI0020C74C0F|nr:hypothetical protein [Shinella daejeonensis]MCP8894349.1 hypothetical protein [Shinella daejeonensis]
MANHPKNTPSETPDSDVEDPHPGSVSQQRLPEADKSTYHRPDGAGVEAETKRKQAEKPALMPGGDPAGAA